MSATQLSLVCHSPEEDGVTIDVIMVFQFPSAESRAVRKRKIRSIHGVAGKAHRGPWEKYNGI